jgi:hypothetical protein
MNNIGKISPEVLTKSFARTSWYKCKEELDKITLELKASNKKTRELKAYKKQALLDLEGWDSIYKG